VAKERGTGKNTESKLRALSIRQPWAHAILHLGKDVENRPMSRNYRGRILIQASLTTTDDERAAARKLGLDSDGLVRGAIVGDVEIIDCVRNSKRKWAIRGQWHRILSNPRVLAKPIQFKGALGFIRVSDRMLRGTRFRSAHRQ
jgi:hypothetical protein